MDPHHIHNQNIHNLNMATYSKPPLCDIICVYCKVALPAVENQEEVERSVRAYVLSMRQQQASDDEIYEGLNKMWNAIGYRLKFYVDTILHFEDTSGSAASAQRKVEKEASDALSRASK